LREKKIENKMVERERDEGDDRWVNESDRWVDKMVVHDGAAVAEAFTGEQKLQIIAFLVLQGKENTASVFFELGFK
jgi:hypothetical protein